MKTQLLRALNGELLFLLTSSDTNEVSNILNNRLYSDWLPNAYRLSNMPQRERQTLYVNTAYEYIKSLRDIVLDDDDILKTHGLTRSECESNPKLSTAVVLTAIVTYSFDDPFSYDYLQFVRELHLDKPETFKNIPVDGNVINIVFLCTRALCLVYDIDVLPSTYIDSDVLRTGFYTAESGLEVLVPNVILAFVYSYHASKPNFDRDVFNVWLQTFTAYTSYLSTHLWSNVTRYTYALILAYSYRFVSSRDTEGELIERVTADALTEEDIDARNHALCVATVDRHWLVVERQEMFVIYDSYCKELCNISSIEPNFDAVVKAIR